MKLTKKQQIIKAIKRALKEYALTFRLLGKK
jgi:hypothetical protein